MECWVEGRQMGTARDQEDPRTGAGMAGHLDPDHPQAHQAVDSHRTVMELQRAG